MFLSELFSNERIVISSNIFLFKGACLFKMSMKVVTKSSFEMLFKFILFRKYPSSLRNFV